jgi:hypothetical protein
MANKQLSSKPMSIDKNNWYYEYPSGIELIHIPEQKEPMVFNPAIHIIISWRKLRASLGRKDRKL